MEKQLLADSVKEDAKSVLNIYGFLIVIFSIIIVLLIAVPKVYLANQIYYDSKEIQRLRVQVEALKEERILLKRKIEAMKFKNSVIYTMF